MSDSIPKSKIQNLACLIDEHHQLFRLFSPVGMTPKFPYLIHYPRIISSFGPPVRYWTMRFEAKKTEKLQKSPPYSSHLVSNYRQSL